MEMSSSTKSDSPYLKLGRLNDVLAAIQTMSIYERYRESCEEWAWLISGDKSKSEHWKSVFDEHPEFFRPSRDFPGEYGLVYRRASTPTDPGRRAQSRPAVPEGYVETLLDTAINLHQRALDQQRDRRWWITPLIAFLSAIGAFVGAIAAAYIKH
jgi:hypothetical protein